MTKKRLIVFSGPSGCGKTTIAQEMLNRHPEMTFSVSATTRPRRACEADGKDYYFISKEDFLFKIERGDLIEWEQIYGDYYGSLRSEVTRAFGSGRSIIFDIDVKGALSIKKAYPDSLLIFIMPPSIEALTERLKNRKTETPETFAKRMERVKMELGQAGRFDHCVVNDSLEKAFGVVDDILNGDSP